MDTQIMENSRDNKIISPTQYADYVFSKYITEVFENLQKGHGSYMNNLLWQSNLYGLHMEHC